MTLCIAWWNGPYVALASDSRLTFREGTGTSPALFVDAGVKLSRITCSIFEPQEQDDQTPKLAHSLEIACLFAGSSTAAYAFRDYAGVSLQRLYHIPVRPLAADDLFELIEKVFEKIARKFREKLHESARVKLFLVMKCPGDESLRSLAVEWGKKAFPTIVRDPFTRESRPYVFGDPDAVSIASEMIAAGKHPLEVLDSIILDKKSVTVGGGLQLGIFGKERLTFQAIDRNVYRFDANSLSEDRKTLTVVHSWGALDLNELNGELQNSAVIAGYPAVSLGDVHEE